MKRDLEYPSSSVGPATLCLIENNDKVLLIDKKRGHGSEYYNFPGGKITPNESPKAAAIRETEEETGVSIWNLHKYAELVFIKENEPFSTVHVFKTSTYSGSPRETIEAIPEWVPYDALPLDEMLPTDTHWIPFLRNDRPVVGEFNLTARNRIKRLRLEAIRAYPLF